MELTEKEYEEMRKKVHRGRKIVSVFGEEIKQEIILELIDSQCGENRVSDIAEKINLSRTVVSRHMQELKDAGILKTRKKGTGIYYYIDVAPDDLGAAIDMLQDAKRILENLPNKYRE